MPNLLDSLVVALELDPAKFGTGAQAAQKKLNDFNLAVKKLGIDETKLTDQQRKRVDEMRRAEVQTARAGKQIEATTVSSKALFSTLEKGAVGFGAALGLYSLKEFAMDAIHSGAALQRMSTTLGMSARAADTWGKAMEENGGKADSMLGTLQGISDELNGFKFGGSIDRLLSISSILSRYNGGKQIPLFGSNGMPLPADQVLLGMADPVHAMGGQQAHALLAGQLPDDVINMLLLGRKGMQDALAKAAPDALTDQQAKDMKRLQEETAELTIAFEKLKTSLLGALMPQLIEVVTTALAWFRYMRSDRTPADAAERDKAIRAGEAMAHQSDDDPKGAKWQARHDAEEAYTRLTASMDETPADQQPWYQSALGLVGVHWGKTVKPVAKPWPKAQATYRLQQLIEGGATIDEAVATVRKEELAGKAPPRVPVAPSRSDLLDAVRAVETGRNPNQTSAAGAQGPYQLMPDTAKQYGVTDPFNEPQARRGAAKFIDDLMRHYDNSLPKVLAAYNWGRGNLDKDIAAHGNQWRAYLPAETAAYIPRVLGGTSVSQEATGNSSEVNFNGPINFYSNATNGRETADDFQKHFIAQADGGPH